MLGVAALPVRGSRLPGKSFKNLYGGAQISWGWKTGPDKHKVKVKRIQRPNVARRRLWSEALEREIRVYTTQRVTKTMDRHGGLDEYLLSSSPSKALGPGRAQQLRERLIFTLRTGVDPDKEYYTKKEAEHDLALKDYVARRDLATEQVLRQEDEAMKDAFTGPYRKYGGEFTEKYVESRKHEKERTTLGMKLIALSNELDAIEKSGRDVFNKMSLEHRTAMLKELQVLDEVPRNRHTEADRFLDFQRNAPQTETVPVTVNPLPYEL